MMRDSDLALSGSLETELFRIGKAECSTIVGLVAAVHLTVRIAESSAKLPGDAYELVGIGMSKMASLLGKCPAAFPPSAADSPTVDLEEVERVARKFFRVIMDGDGPAVACFTLLQFAGRLCRPPHVWTVLDWMKRHREKFATLGPTEADMRAAATGAS
jgi:hypothetical protein